MASDPVIRVQALRKSYGRAVAVDDFSFDVEQGEIFGLIGPNGAGKTTTMECVEGLRGRDRGTVSVLGLDPGRDRRALQERIGVQLQEAQLQKRITVREAVDLWASLYRSSVDGDRLLEPEIFVREPLGVIGTVAMPVLLFILVGRLVGPRLARAGPAAAGRVAGDLPVFVSLFVTLGAVLSLVAIMATYREGGILKRLRATPLRPYTIPAAHVLVKLLFSGITVAAMLLAGRSYYPAATGVPLASFSLAVVFTTASILLIGFLLTSVVPTARFAQPFGALVLYPMLGLSGIFVPSRRSPPACGSVPGCCR